MKQLWALQNNSSNRGFTIVELLIVIVVIGILAAITIVAFNGIQQRATSTTIRSDLASMHKKIELYKAKSDSGQYPSTAAELVDAELTVTKSAYLTPTDRAQFYYCLSTDMQQYAMGVISKDNKGFFMVNGTVTEIAGAGTTIFGSNTCSRAETGKTTGAQTGWNNSTNSWSSWVKG